MKNETNNNGLLSPTNWRTGTSSSLFRGLTEKDLEACREAGIECVEVCIFGNCFELEKKELEQFCRKLDLQGEKLGVEFWSVHLPFSRVLDISATDEAQRRTVIQINKERLEAAACFKPKKAVIHPSFEPIEENREEHLKICRESLKELSDYSHQLGIQLVVECLPRTCLGNTSEEIEKIIEGLDHIGICCDTNHLLKETTEAFIRKLGPRIVTLHVSDYDRVDERHWKPGLGVNNWNAIIGALAAHQYSGPWMFELRQPSPEKPITPADLKECWNSLLASYASSNSAYI